MDDVTNTATLYVDVSCIELTNVNMKFFKNALFCSKLQDYLRVNYAVDYRISAQVSIDDEIGISIGLAGVETNIQLARDFIKELFRTVKTKVYNNENTDKKVIYWSKNIYSDATTMALQKTFDNYNLFTVWEKTDIISGYYAVHYFSSNHIFEVPEASIDCIINNTIAYVQNIIVPNFDRIQTNFRKELDKFINEEKQLQQQVEVFTIIFCKYPLQKELKISFFGINYLVNDAKNQLKRLLQKHEMKTVNIELDSTQRDYLLVNCVCQLKNIELEYTDDNVKIQIRENVFYAPEYLTLRIEQLIKSLIVQTTTIVYQCIDDFCLLQTNEKVELERIAQQNNCHIDRIDVQTKNELVKLPKIRTTSTIQSTSQHIIQESNQFINTRTILKRLVTSTGRIEIYPTKLSTTPTADVTIVSVIPDTIKEQIGIDSGNFYSKTNTNKRVLYIPWTPPPSITVDSDQTGIILQQSIREFVSLSLAQIARLRTNDVKRIAISTLEWENYSNKNQLAKEIIRQLKEQLETEPYSKRGWIIVFIFDNKQFDLYDLFSQVILSMQTEMHDYDEFYCSISTITIHLRTSQHENISKRRKVINDYFRKHIISTIELDDAFDPQIWNQHTINAYYKYCLEKFVIPTIYPGKKQKERQTLELTGRIFAIDEMKQRYVLMSEIIKQKTLMNEQSGITRFDQYPQLNLDVTYDRYNIIILYCPEDESFSNRLATRLIDEGYLICVNQSSRAVGSQFGETDLIIVYFSQHYSKNEDCIAQIKLAKMSGKKIIPIVPRKTRIEQDNNWLDYVTFTDLYYELFRDEIQFELDEDLGLQYDKLLVALLQYTKPGKIGQTYSTLINDLIQEEQPEETSNEQNSQPAITIEQRRQREEVYEKCIQKIIDREKISADEVAQLMDCLTMVMEYCRTCNPTGTENIREEEAQQDTCGQNLIRQYKQNKSSRSLVNQANTQSNVSHLGLCITRWMNKATHGTITRGNLPPFSLTGDVNDAPYPILLVNKTPWWTSSAIYADLDHSPPERYFHNPPAVLGSWLNHTEVDDYFQTLINRDIQFHIETRKQRRLIEINRFAGKFSKLLHDSEFTTELKDGQIAWAFSEDKLILNEYRRIRIRNKTNKSVESLTAWEYLVMRTVQLLSDLKTGKIDVNSDIIQGKIGDELKTQEELQKLNKLDDPNNTRWTIKQPRKCTREFLQAKIQNTIDLQRLCKIPANL